MSFLMAETIYLFPYSNRYVCDFSLYKKISTTCQTSWQRAFKTKTSKFQQTFTQFWHVKNSTRFHSSSSMFSIFWSSHFRYHSYPRNQLTVEKILSSIYHVWMKVFKHPNMEVNKNYFFGCRKILVCENNFCEQNILL